METHLTIKHIAPYLPYMLTAITQNRIVEIDGIDYRKELPIMWHEIGAKNSKFTGICGLGLMPILRPLSDLTPEYLMVDSNLDICDQIELSELMSQKMNFAHLRYGLAVHLFENHFDCFGLIESGLAISIHDIKKI